VSKQESNTVSTWNSWGKYWLLKAIDLNDKGMYGMARSNFHQLWDAACLHKDIEDILTSKTLSNYLK
jgi:hypothetical protein